MIGESSGFLLLAALATEDRGWTIKELHCRRRYSRIEVEAIITMPYKLQGAESLPTRATLCSQLSSCLVQVRSDVRKLSLGQLCVPKDGVCVAKAVLHPSLLLHVVQIDVTT